MHLTEYVISVANKSFSRLPFNEVDALVFAQLSYYDYSVFEDGISFKEIKSHKNIFKATDLKNLRGDKIDEKMFNLVIGSKRYEDTIIKWHTLTMQKKPATQFSATTFINNDLGVIAFRGTDGTVIGWHEDLDMTYQFPIPSQVLAQRYINDVLPKMDVKDIKVVGHSKGGNIAVYAAVMTKSRYQKYISDAYNFDGPGFVQAFYDLDNYYAIKDRIHKFVPVQSSIGRMMLTMGDFKVIKSDESYVMQHWAHNWKIVGNHFEYAKETDFFSESVEESSMNVLESLSPEERRDAVSTMFEILDKTNCEYMDDITLKFDKVMICIKEYAGLKEKNANVKRFITELFKPMIKAYYEKGKETAQVKFNIKKDEIVEKVKSIFKRDDLD